MSFLKRWVGKKREAEGAVALGAGLGGAAASAPEAAATDALVQGMERFQEVAERLVRVDPAFSHGKLFEYIEAAKFNADAARQASSLRAVVTADLREPTAPDDLRIMSGDELLQRVQAKSYQVKDQADLARLTRTLSDPKYDEMQKLTNREHAEAVHSLAARRGELEGSLEAERYRDTAANVTGEMRAENVSSGGTSYRESRFAAENPRLYAAATEAKYVAQEAATAAASAAAAAAIVGGAISVVRHGLAVRDGEITGAEATKRVAADAARSGGRGAAVGAGGALLRAGARKAGADALTTGNAATAVAASVIDVGAAVYRYAKGEIAGEALAEQVGQTGTSTISSLYVGAATGAVFGPLGAVVGSMAGYMLSSHLYQSSMAILRGARLAEAEASRLEALSAEAVRQMAYQRAEFERLLAESMQEQREAFTACFAHIDRSLASDQPGEAIQGLAAFAQLLGQKLPPESFDAFDRRMQGSSEPLRI